MSDNIKNTSEGNLVSIICPAYNSSEFISESINSVLKQTYTNFELIIVDDCSTDNTFEKINNYASKDNRIKIVKLKKNSGAAVSRNKGIEISTGRFLAFLDSDDVWEKDKLDLQLKFMINNKFSFTCTNYNKINEFGMSLNTNIEYPFKTNYKKLLKNNCGNSTVMYDTSVVGKIFIPDIKKRNDYLMWLQVIKKAETLYCLEKNLGSHRIRSGSISSNKFDLIKYHWMVYRKYEKLSVAYSAYLVFYWSFKTLKISLKNRF